MRDSQSLILKPLFPYHEHGLSVSTNSKTQKGRSYKRGMLVHGMKYGFMVRAYKKVNGKKIYGPFTAVKKRY